MTPFTDRNPVSLGIGGVLATLLALAIAFFSEDLPVIGGGTTYTAQFREIAGLRESNEVRVSGVRVGKVTGIEIDGDKVAVRFRVKDVFVGERSTVSIEIKTLLGRKYLALEPKGEKPLGPGTPIPLGRTRAPFDVTDVLDQLGHTVDDIDTKQLSKSFDVISSTFADTGPRVRSTLDGLSKLSSTIAARDRQLATLLGNTKVVTGTLAMRDRQLKALIGDGNVLLVELRRRKDAVDRLLDGVQNLSVQLTGVVSDNQHQINPALQRLDRVATLLQQNQAQVAAGIKNLATFYRVYANTLSNGRWFDVYVCGVLPPNVDLSLLNVNPKGCQPPQPKARGGGR